MQTIPANIHLEGGKKVQITTIETQGWYINFRAFGAFNPSKPDSINAIDYISKFTKAELFLFYEVDRHTEENSTLTLRPKSYSPAEQAKLKKAIPLWIKKGLLVRIKREYYVVNPWFLVPPKKEQLDAINRWKELNN